MLITNVSSLRARANFTKSTETLNGFYFNYFLLWLSTKITVSSKGAVSICITVKLIQYIQRLY